MNAMSLRQAVERAESLAVGTLGLSALLVACSSTVARYFAPALARDWGDEVVVYLSVWAMWLAAGRLVRRNEHVRAEVLSYWLGPSAQRALEIVHALLGLCFCALMAWAGLQVVDLSLQTFERSESSLQLPMAVYYASMPVGMVMMASAYGLRLVAALRGRAAPVASSPH